MAQKCPLPSPLFPISVGGCFPHAGCPSAVTCRCLPSRLASFCHLSHAIFSFHINHTTQTGTHTRQTSLQDSIRPSLQLILIDPGTPLWLIVFPTHLNLPGLPRAPFRVDAINSVTLAKLPFSSTFLPRGRPISKIRTNLNSRQVTRPSLSLPSSIESMANFTLPQP